MAENNAGIKVSFGKDITGIVFGRLRVVSFAGTRPKPKGKLQKMWRCKCDCGASIVTTHWHLFGHRVTSCGCDSVRPNTNSQKTHATSGRGLYHVWEGMHCRCYTKSSGNYHMYGGRGICILEPWKSSFEAFLKDMESSYKRGLMIERADNNGHYCLENCRWATPMAQGANKRNNVILSVNGVSKHVAAWARELGLDRSLIYGRISRGWSHARALGL